MNKIQMTNIELMKLFGIDYTEDMITSIRIDMLPNAMPTITITRLVDMVSPEQYDEYVISITKKEDDE